MNSLKLEKELKKVNQEFELLKDRKFQIRRGRGGRIFYKSVMKTVFDYDTQEESGPSEEEFKVGQKRTH